MKSIISGISFKIWQRPCSSAARAEKSALADHNANTAKVVLSKDVANEVLKNAVEAQDYTVISVE